MSTTDVLQRGGADLQSTDDRARAAVKAFHRMQPALTAYARAVTGRHDVQVVVSPTSNGHTDGKKIYFRPPLALGDNTPHQRKLCDKRDRDTLIQLCPACDAREQVLITIYHEIAHIAFGSFEEMNDQERADALKYGLSLVDKKFAQAVMARVKAAPPYAKSTYIGMAGLISPFLPGIVNALEDARVNRAAATARKGTKVMFQVDTSRVLSEGYEAKMEDGSIQTVFWRDRPLNAQMICALYARFAGYPMEEHFVPEVVAALDDEQIRAIQRDFSTVRNAKGVYALSIALLVRLRELGFYKHSTDPQVEDEEDEQQPEPEEPDDQQPEESEDDGADDSGDEETPEQAAGGDDGSEDETGDPEESEGSDEGEADSGSEEESQGEVDSDDGDADADDDGEGESRLDEGADPTDAGVGEDSDDSAGDGAGEQAEASDDGSEAGPDEGTSSDESGGGESGDDADSLPEPAEQQDASAGSEQGDAVDDSSDEGSDGSDPSSPDGEASDGDGSESDLESSDGEGGENADPGTGGDHDSAEAGSTVQGVDDQEAVDEAEPDADLRVAEPRGDTGGEGDAGTAPEDSDDAADDGIQDGDLDESDDGAPVNSAGDDGDPEGDSEVIDTGADEGLGGIEVHEDSAFDRLPMGDPEEVNETIHEIAHPEERPEHIAEEEDASEEMDRAIVQGLYFETPSRKVFGVREHTFGEPIIVDGHNMSQAWAGEYLEYQGYTRRQRGIEGDFAVSEAVLGPALLRMRVAFADNRRGHDLRNRKSGKVDGRVLGKRAIHGDERLFKKRSIPGKKDYFVLIGIDVSGSTIGANIKLAKRAAMAQAELLHRMGITFAVYAHSGNYHSPNSGRIQGLDMDIYVIKDPNEAWTADVKHRLEVIGPDTVNLDGHTFEYYRKILDQRTETHRVILYYTDGKMPAENHDEELVILQREIKICRQKKYVLMGVGIRTDSPEAHGLETVKVVEDSDIVKVVQRLEKRLLAIA